MQKLVPIRNYQIILLLLHKREQSFFLSFIFHCFCKLSEDKEKQNFLKMMEMSGFFHRFAVYLIFNKSLRRKKKDYMALIMTKIITKIILQRL